MLVPNNGSRYTVPRSFLACLPSNGTSSDLSTDHQAWQLSRAVMEIDDRLDNPRASSLYRWLSKKCASTGEWLKNSLRSLISGLASGGLTSRECKESRQFGFFALTAGSHLRWSEKGNR